MNKELTKLQMGDMKSVAYFTFYYPRTFSEGIRYIYNKRPQSVGQEPIINARNWLKSHGFIEYDQETFRNRKITSTTLPLQLYIEESFQRLQRNVSGINKEFWDQTPQIIQKHIAPTKKPNAFSKIFGSKWFRESFFHDDSIGDTISFRGLVSWDEGNGRLRVSSGIGAVMRRVSDVIAIPASIAHPLKKFFPPVSELQKYEKFEGFAEAWHARIRSKLDMRKLEKLVKVCREFDGTKYLVNKTLGEEPFYGLCIPREIVDVISRLDVFIGSLSTVFWIQQRTREIF